MFSPRYCGAGARALALAIVCTPAPAWSQDHKPQPPAPPADRNGKPDDVVVTGQSDPLHLDDTTQTGSRLTLSVRETPASIEVLTQDRLQSRGLRTTREAFADITGAIAGDVPGNPATVTLRGFSGNAVTILFDGVRAGSSTIVGRDIDLWNYDRVEVIKGPASVLDGEGALAGAINLISKKPSLQARTAQMLASVGAFGTARVAGDINVPLSGSVAMLASASYLRSDSLYDVDDNDYRSINATTSLLWQPSERVTALFAVDYGYDRSAATYQGSPLVPRGLARDPSDVVDDPAGLVVDAATRRVNYNPLGSYQDARSETVRGRVDADLGNGWTLTDNAQYYHAARSFVYSNDQTFRPSTGLLSRSLREISNRQDFYDNRLTLGRDGPLFGLRDRFTIGVEHNHTRFHDPRRFGVLAPVTPFDPIRGTLPSDDPANFPGAGNNVLFRTRLNQTAVFVENALNLTPALLLVGGLRREVIGVDRAVTDYALNTTVRFRPRFKPVSGRIGAVWSVQPTVQLYAQYATAVVPVGTLLILSGASGAFDLSTGDTQEAGIKGSFLGERVSFIAAVYRISLDRIVTIDPVTNRSVQGGSQSSRGVEATLAADLLPTLHLDVGAATGGARFDRLIEAGGADRAGKTPPNTPSTTFNAGLLYSPLRLPVTLGAFARHVSDFYTDNANTYAVRGHTTIDASVAFRVPSGTITLRGRNLTNALYGEYSGYPATQVYLGAPRGVEVSYAAHF